MKRRDFLRAASVPAAAATASATAGIGVAQETEASGETADGTAAESGEGGEAGTDAGTGTEGGGDQGGGGGGTEEVVVGPGGDLTFEPGTDEPLQIAPGTTVNFVWDSDNHNIVVDSQPEDANWEGHEPLEKTGFEYSHTFEVLGTYEYYCEPHEMSGMVGAIEVTENPDAGGGEGGGEKDLHDLGVPIHAHWVGAATILGILVTVIFTFYILKYGESAHTGTGRNE